MMILDRRRVLHLYVFINFRRVEGYSSDEEEEDSKRFR